jgi:peptidyl-tRNA hydrolase
LSIKYFDGYWVKSHHQEKNAVLVIVGLESENGRGAFAPHAVGARFVDYLASLSHEDSGAPLWQERPGFETYNATVNGEPCLLVKPRCEYNDCGSIVMPQLLLDFLPQEIVVAHDDFMVPSGTSEFRERLEQGSGNRGVMACAKAIGTDFFPTAAIGVENQGGDTIDLAFFHREMTQEEQAQVQASFPALLESITQYEERGPSFYPQEIRLSAHAARNAQVPGRTATCPFSPVRVVIDRTVIDRLNKAINMFVRVVSSVAGRYAEKVHENDFSSPLVQLLERGVPELMIQLIRGAKAHLQHMSFDFRGGKLLEINAAPLPPLSASQARDILGIPGPGKSLNLAMLTEIPERLALKVRRDTGNNKILLVNRIGESETGGSWYSAVQKHLQERGFDAVIGTAEEHPDAGVLWANMTWMTPDRWPSVMTEAVQQGKARIFPSPRNFLFTSKWFLSLLSSRTARKILGIEEGADTEKLEDILPCTMDLEEGSGFIRFAIRNHHRLYAKPYLSSGGRGGKAIERLSDLRHVERPAVAQEWTDAWAIEGTDLRYELRVVVYGAQGENRTWEGLVWRTGEKLNAPLIAPITYE